jgi:hypothetical protein
MTEHELAIDAPGAVLGSDNLSPEGWAYILSKGSAPEIVHTRATPEPTMVPHAHSFEVSFWMPGCKPCSCGKPFDLEYVCDPDAKYRRMIQSS